MASHSVRKGALDILDILERGLRDTITARHFKS